MEDMHKVYFLLCTTSKAQITDLWCQLFRQQKKVGYKTESYFTQYWQPPYGKYTGCAKKRGHRHMTTILSNLIRFKKHSLEDAKRGRNCTTENVKSEHVPSNRPIHIGTTPDTTQTGPSCRVERSRCELCICFVFFFILYGRYAANIYTYY